MLFGILADIVVWFHLAFVLFAVLGAFLVLFRRWMIWLHLPAVFWAVWIELSGKTCPLTPLEIWLRKRAGQGGYHGDFVEHYLMPLLYPVDLTRDMQLMLGFLVVFINMALYGYIVYQIRRKR